MKLGEQRKSIMPKREISALSGIIVSPRPNGGIISTRWGGTIFCPRKNGRDNFDPVSACRNRVKPLRNYPAPRKLWGAVSELRWSTNIHFVLGIYGVKGVLGFYGVEGVEREHNGFGTCSSVTFQST